MTAELLSIVDLIRYGASQFNRAGLTFGHGHDSAIDESAQLVMHVMQLPPDIPSVYAQSRVTAEEKRAVLDLFERRIRERVPAAYLVGEAWFAGLAFKSDSRALVPRSPIAELILDGFEPWLGERPVARVLDLCTGSGCIAIAMAVHQPHWQVDAVDLSDDALALAAENARLLDVARRVRLMRSDLFSGLAGEVYDLIVSNPPYVPAGEVPALPPEYAHEPSLGLAAGTDGLDLALRILRDAPRHLSDDGLLVVEVGDSEAALVELLPGVPFNWIEFKVGQMGVFALDAEPLREALPQVSSLCTARGLCD
jgi:ribosomal protein L3 glutamine methyltransferase